MPVEPDPPQKSRRRRRRRKKSGGVPGKPEQLPNSAADAALRRLMALGVQRDNEGGIYLSPEAQRALREDRFRRAALTEVPSTLRHVYRDVGPAVGKGQGRMTQVRLDSLRKFRDRLPILQVIHRARQTQVKRVAKKWSGRKGDVGWRVGHVSQHDSKVEVPEGFQPVIDRFARMLERPSPTYCKTSSQLYAMLEEDYLTINRPALEVIYSAFDRDRIVGCRPVDGGILWPTLVYLEKWIKENPKWGRVDTGAEPVRHQLEILSLALDMEFTDAEYVLVRDGLAEHVYPRGKIILFPEATRTDIQYAGYPPSRVEEALEIILAWWNAWKWNTSYFTMGMMSEFILGIVGDVHPADIKTFVDTFREASQGVNRAHRPPIVPLPVDGTLQKIDLRQPNTEMGFEGWIGMLGSLAGALYRMDPSTFGWKPWNPGGGSSLSEPSREREIELAEADGLGADLNHINENGINELARRCHPELRVFMETGQHDPKAEAEVYEVRARVSITRNEVRVADGDPPMGFWVPIEEYRGWCDDLATAAGKDGGEIDEGLMKKITLYEANPWNQPTDGGFQSAKMGQDQAMQALQQPEEPEPGDGFGGPGQETGAFGDEGYPPFAGGPGGGAPGGPGQRPGAPGGAPPGSMPGGRPPPQALQKAHEVTVFVEPLRPRR